MRRSIRDMSEREKKRRSLPVRTVSAALISCIVFGLTALVIGLASYRSTLADSGVSADDIISGMKTFALQLIAALLVLTAVIACILSRYFRRTIAEPINTITQAAAAYAADKIAGTTYIDRFIGLDIHTGDELENLCLTMADMENDLTVFEEQLTRVTAEKERAATEMLMAARIQESMLPNIFPPYPDRDEFEIFAVMDPAKEVGGDFYDFFFIDDDHLCLVMADVSGKGVPAALFMMISKIIIQSCAMLGQSAADILTKTNDTLCSNNKVEMFVTVWLGILELSTGKVSAANAGHEYPALCRKGGEFELMKTRHGFVLGGMPGMRYKGYELQLEPGDMLFLYTDGVPEATNAAEELFGLERMISALNGKSEGASPFDVVGLARNAVDQFVGDEEQFDDITMMCIRYNGQQTY